MYPPSQKLQLITGWAAAGGMHDHPYHHERMVHIQEQTLDVMHVDQTGVLYVDFMGSMFEDFAPETGFLKTALNALHS